MRGFPKGFTTKQDYLNCLEIFPKRTKVELKRLLAERFYWKKTKDLNSADDGVSDETHRVAEEKAMDEKTGKETMWYSQLEWCENPNAAMFRLGFTVKELKKLVS